MVMLPGAIPVTIPAGVIVAMVLSLVLQVPPPVVSVKAGVVEPTQTAGAPPMMEANAGSALTVTVALVAFVQLLPSAAVVYLSLIHISEPTRQAEISYAVFC